MNGNRGAGTRIRIARDTLAACAAALALGATGCAHANGAATPAPAAKAAAAPLKKMKFAKVVYVDIDAQGCPVALPTFDFDDGTEDPPGAACKSQPCVYVPKGKAIKLQAKPGPGAHTKFSLAFKGAGSPFKNEGAKVGVDGTKSVTVTDTPTGDYLFTVQPPQDLVDAGTCRPTPDPQMIPM